MRWIYFIPRMIIIGLLWGFLAYAVDPLLRYSTVHLFQSVTGAKVNVAELHTTYFPPSLTIHRMALTGAGRSGESVVEFDELHVRLESHSLSRRRFVIEDGHIDGLRFDTLRGDHGQLESCDNPDLPEPSRATEKLTEPGDEWLSSLKERIKSQLDPKNIETYRVGTGVYEKWDVRFKELVALAQDLDLRASVLKQDLDRAKNGDILQQIGQYLTVAHDAEILVRDAKVFRNDLIGIVPEVRADLQLLNDARMRDQSKVRQMLALPRPDARRISQALLGETMSLRLQEILTWVETIRDYRHELHEQIQPPRTMGRDFDFRATRPAPNFLLKNLRMTGVISVRAESVPFRAQLSDVTDDPALWGRPCVLSLVAAGSRPMQLKVTYDATQATPVAEILAEFQDTLSIPLSVGKPEEARLQAVLNHVTWQSQLVIVENRIHGHMALDSKLDHLAFSADGDVRPEIIEAANDVFASLQTLNATVKISGTVRTPEIDLHSDIGEQVASGVRATFTYHMEVAKGKLIAEVNDYADEQFETLRNRFDVEYGQLKRDNKDLLASVAEVQTLVDRLQSDNIDARSLVKQVLSSGMISDKDRAKINRAMAKVDTRIVAHPKLEEINRK